MNKYLVDFFSIKSILEKNYDSLETLKKDLKPLILKLNNPTYYSKHLYAHPIERYDYPASFEKNIFIKFTKECIKIMNECQDIFEAQKKLQVEYSWTANYPISLWVK